MNNAPLTRSQLVGLPFWGALLGAGMAGFFVPWLGREWALVLAVVQGASLAALGGWIAYRSDFGGRHGIAGAAFMLLLLAPLVTGTAVMTLSLAGQAQLSWLAVGSGLASLSIAFAAGYRRQWATLQREGVDGAWARTNVDPRAARLRASALLGRDPSTAAPSPWLAAALAANIPLLYSAWGVSDAQAMPFVLAALAGVGVWVCARHLGPMAARGSFVLQLERHHGRRIVHEHHDDLQALRQEFWLSRRLMEAAPTGSPPPRRRPRPAAPPVPLRQRVTLGALEIVAGLGFVGGITLAGFEVWPALDRSLRWDDYRPAEVLVVSVELASRRSQWLGRGSVDGQEVRFSNGELDALLGPPPSSSADPRMASALAQLPLRVQARWNPQAQRRLIALDAPRESVDGQARFAMGFCAAFFVVGALALGARRAVGRWFSRGARSPASR